MVVRPLTSSYDATMAFEVYSGHTAAWPRRALWMSALLLAVTMAMAATMTSTRGRDPLGGRVGLEGSPISFRAPRSFELDNPVTTSQGPAIPMYGVTGAAHSVMVVRFIPSGQGATAKDLARTILSNDGTEEHLLLSLLRGMPPTTPEPLGPFEGVEARDRAGAIVTRAALGPSGDGYAVTLRVEGAVIDPTLYRLFDLVCRSVETRQNGY